MKLRECRGVIEAVNGACSCGGNGPGDGCPACEVWHVIADFEFADDPRPALAPRDPSPELAEAEARLRREATTGPDCVERSQCATIVAELLASVDDFVRGKAITEEIMQLRTKTAIIRDRMARRAL